MSNSLEGLPEICHSRGTSSSTLSDRLLPDLNELLTSLSSADDLYDGVSRRLSGASSELSLPFPDSFLKPLTFSTKDDSKCRFVPKFSAEHSRALEETLSSTQTSFSLERELLESCEEEPEVQRTLSPTLLESIRSLREDFAARLAVATPSLAGTDDGVPSGSTSSGVTPADDLSGLWRMLSAYDDFRITPAGYDAFGLDGPHWLDGEQVPWTVMEESRDKCLEWLDRNPHLVSPAKDGD